MDFIKKQSCALSKINITENNGKARNVLIIGNEITEGMLPFYSGFFGRGVKVNYFTTSCFISDENYFLLLEYALKEYKNKYDIICFTPSLNYDDNSQLIKTKINETAEKIKALQPLSRIIFVGNTMVDPLKAGKNKNLIIYGGNKALEFVAAENGGQYIDLGTFSEKIITDHIEDGILFTDAGYKKLTFEVIKHIK